MKNLKLLGLGKVLFLEKEFKDFREYCFRMLKMVTETAKRRLEILNFYKKYGLKHTLSAFKISRSTLFRWQKLLKEMGRIESLSPKSKRPHRLRKSKINPLIIEKIKELRRKYPRLGKEKIKIILDNYCQDNNLPSISYSSIYRIIKKLQEKQIIPSNKKISFYAKSGLIKIRYNFKGKSKLRRKDYQPEEPEDLFQIDAISIFLFGLKRYIITAIDLNSDFAFAYTHLSSKTSIDFFN